MKIFLDDLRTPQQVYGENNWTVVRSYNEFKELIDSCFDIGLPISVISFDHDLADEHYKDLFDSYKDMRDLNYDGYKEKTGLDALKYFLNKAGKFSNSVYTIKIHSMNPVGKENMYKYIDSFMNNDI